LRVGPDERWWSYPVDGGEPRAINGLTEHDTPIAWRADNRSIFVVMHHDENKMLRVSVLDIASGQKTLWKELRPSRPVDERPSEDHAGRSRLCIQFPRKAVGLICSRDAVFLGHNRPAGFGSVGGADSARFNVDTRSEIDVLSAGPVCPRRTLAAGEAHCPTALRSCRDSGGRLQGAVDPIAKRSRAPAECCVRDPIPPSPAGVW